MLETIASAITSFFAAQPAMLDQVPQLGHLPKVFKAMTSRNDAVPKTSLQIVHQLANSEVIRKTRSALPLLSVCCLDYLSSPLRCLPFLGIIGNNVWHRSRLASVALCIKL